MATATRPAGRYDTLTQLIPKGNYYACDGDILPFSDEPYQLDLRGTAPNALHAIMLNGRVHTEEIITDNGNLVSVAVALDLGENVIDVVNRHDQSKHTVYITTRHWATWLASVSDLIAEIDSNIAAIHSNQYLNTVNADKIDEVWGRRLWSANVADYELNTYRDILINLHQAYRRYGGRLRGLMQAVSSFTQVNPLVLPVGFGAEWRLGSDFIDNYFTCTEPSVPDAWIFSGATLAQGAGYFKPTALIVNATGAWEAYTTVQRNILRYRGHTITYGMWCSRVTGQPAPADVTVRVELSFDGGTTWDGATDVVLNNSATTPIRSYGQMRIPVSATGVAFKVSCLEAVVSHLRLDRAFFKVDIHTASTLGKNTVVRTKHQQKRGYKCFVWCPERLTWGERQQIGITQDNIGHIHRIVPIHVALAVYNLARATVLPSQFAVPLG